MGKKDNGYILQSLDNAFRLIDILAVSEEMGVTELSESLGLGKSTIFRILKTLEKWNYVIQNEDNNKYRIGMKFSNIGSMVMEKNTIIKYSKPYIQELAFKLKETVHLMKLEDNYEIIFLDKVNGPLIMNMESRVGGYKPAYIAASGKLYLSEMNDEELDLYLNNIEFEKFTEKTIDNKDDLLKELSEVRKKGYAVNNEESQNGLLSYAVAIRDTRGNIIASISISGMISRMLDDKDYKLKSLMETAKKIESAIST